MVFGVCDRFWVVAGAGVASSRLAVLLLLLLMMLMCAVVVVGASKVHAV